MKHVLATIIMSGVLAFCCVPSVATQAEYTIASVALNTSVATLRFLTALPGEKLADIAAGQTVTMSSLSEQQRNEILDAARSMMPEQEFERRFGGQSGTDDLTVMVWSNFIVTLSGGALGSKSTIPLQPAWNLPGNGPTEPALAKVDEPAPAIADTQSLGAILASAPTDTAARANYLRARAVEILEPLGVYRLNKANVPVAIRRFTSAEKVKLAELSEKDKAWLQGVYATFCAKAAELGEKYRVSGVTGTSTIGFVPTEWLSKSPPSWSDLGDATVEFAVQYLPIIAPADMGSNGRGGGWSLQYYKIPED